MSIPFPDSASVIHLWRLRSNSQLALYSFIPTKKARNIRAELSGDRATFPGLGRLLPNVVGFAEALKRL